MFTVLRRFCMEYVFCSSYYYEVINVPIRGAQGVRPNQHSVIQWRHSIFGRQKYRTILRCQAPRRVLRTYSVLFIPPPGWTYQLRCFEWQLDNTSTSPTSPFSLFPLFPFTPHLKVYCPVLKEIPHSFLFQNSRIPEFQTRNPSRITPRPPSYLPHPSAVQPNACHFTQHKPINCLQDPRPALPSSQTNFPRLIHQPCSRKALVSYSAFLSAKVPMGLL